MINPAANSAHSLAPWRWASESVPVVEPIKQSWLAATGIVLLAYAVMGKGAGYIGFPPIFIGELLLIAGAASVLLFGKFSLLDAPDLLWCVALFAFWGLFRTLPYLSAYGVDALRDAVIWGYSAFAFIWYFYILDDERRLIVLLKHYQLFTTLALVGMAAAWAIRFLLADRTPQWPWAEVPIIELKSGDIMVHLGGILAFWVSSAIPAIDSLRLSLLCIFAGVMSAYERSAMFAFCAAYALCLAFRPKHRLLHSLGLMAFIAMAALAISGVVWEVPVADSSKIREISFMQFAANVASAIMPSDMGDLDDTKEWRVNWWKEIIAYTIHGDHFWTGKGFGINLADDDGFQVMEDHSLRSPHNASLALLARTGVPGLALWALLQLGWGYSIFSALLRSLRAGDRQWAGLFLFLFAYWLAFILNSMFDVFLEGPMGGIWFWSLFGVGLAAHHIWKHRPELLTEYANPYCP